MRDEALILGWLPPFGCEIGARFHRFCDSKTAILQCKFSHRVKVTL
jgi:hypothetical protein